MHERTTGKKQQGWGDNREGWRLVPESAMGPEHKPLSVLCKSPKGPQRTEKIPPSRMCNGQSWEEPLRGKLMLLDLKLRQKLEVPI